VSDNRHRQRWTPADTHDGLPQARRAEALAARAATWLRDEEASGSTRATHLTTIDAGPRLPCSACLPACLPRLSAPRPHAAHMPRLSHMPRCVAEFSRIRSRRRLRRRGPPSAPRSALGGPRGARRAIPQDARSGRLYRSACQDGRAVFLTADCPDRGRRVNGAPAGRRKRSAAPTIDPPSSLKGWQL
jgi:hypothetical protein